MKRIVESSKRVRRGKRGASLTGYGLVVGLIAVLAIGAVASVGDEISGLFDGVGDEMDGVATGSDSGSSSDSEEAEDPCASSLTSADHGLECADGAFFAGTVGGNDIFIAPADEDDSTADCTGGYDSDGYAGTGCFEVPNGNGDENNKYIAWNNDQNLNTGGGSLADGLANTQALTDGPPNPNDDPVGSMANNDGPHPAANACATKSLGSGDWFLPARDELHATWDNLVDNGEGSGTAGDGNLHVDEQSFAETTYGFDFSGNFGDGRYWSSSESSTFPGLRALSVRFADGLQSNSPKHSGLSVRCVRR